MIQVQVAANCVTATMPTVGSAAWGIVSGNGYRLTKSPVRGRHNDELKRAARVALNRWVRDGYPSFFTTRVEL